MRQNLNVNLPCYVREMILIMIQHFKSLLLRHHPKLTFDTELDNLQVFRLTRFTPTNYSKESMKEFKFHLIPPFYDYQVNVTGLSFDANARTISYVFSVDPELITAVNQGLQDSPNLRGAVEVFNDKQHLLTLSEWPSDDILGQMDQLTKKMAISDHFCHQDMFANTMHDTAALAPDSMYRLVLVDDSLAFVHQTRVATRHAELLQKRRTGRNIINIPAQPAQVVAVPGNAQENADELAALQADLARINARLQVLNPAVPAPNLDGGAGGAGGGAAGGAGGGENEEELH